MCLTQTNLVVRLSNSSNAIGWIMVVGFTTSQSEIGFLFFVLCDIFLTSLKSSICHAGLALHAEKCDILQVNFRQTWVYFYINIEPNFWFLE